MDPKDDTFEQHDLNELALGLEPVAPPAAVKVAVMAAIGAQPRGFVSSSAETWRAHQIPGVKCKELSVDAENDRATYLMRLAPGTTIPAHAHAATEECYVLEGSCEIAGLQLSAGDFLRANRGTTHGPIFSAGGCLVLLSSSVGEYRDALRA
jgi:anti-sigma factor ChrR (cupin superfamily)